MFFLACIPSNCSILRKLKRILVFVYLGSSPSSTNLLHFKVYFYVKSRRAKKYFFEKKRKFYSREWFVGVKDQTEPDRSDQKLSQIRFSYSHPPPKKILKITQKNLRLDQFFIFFFKKKINFLIQFRVGNFNQRILSRKIRTVNFESKS